MKSKFLYHGSVRKIKGSKFIPKIPEDIEQKPENLHFGVYATDIKEIAIAMAIISCKGINYASLSFNKPPYGVIYEGGPEQKYIYLYKLPKKTFKKSGKNQYVSKHPVKPLSYKKLAVNSYLYLVREANNKERKEHINRYRKFLKIKNET